MVVIILSWLFPQLYRTPFVFFFFMLLLFPWSSLSFLVSGFHNQLLSYWIVNTIRYKPVTGWSLPNSSRLRAVLYAVCSVC